ncbi:tRNA dihydrouridine synthase DusB [Jannaschia seohaensis]|uniref:tRNA-dihydrouridine synthase n=1 Tax=Jannaschia seohaensis TaxID=475081 RepID=A0A2Y9B254_9RHOB|nr:tRNA dihydrouridine synthase DusB [Jannaschia seohaensis]PWJ15873.1 nifR3 family TIM-barrel protein [Jannaschia seohaensis]SSA49578.1 putative TIM-barrel protein, nifR3 family [Jannaschia seohaensis]
MTEPVALAPMAGITDLPMRDLVRGFGAGLVVSEMVASREMVHAKRSVRDRAEIGAGAAGTSVQIAGREAYWMAEAARVLEGQGARIIDINMGCPAKKVVGGASGSALLRDHDHALTLIEAVVEAVSVPVTLKTRLGWDDSRRDTARLASRAEAAGIAMFTVHGRTRCQFYKGAADWAAVREIVEAVEVPVLVNGDIVDTATARQALEQSGAAGVMVGRGIQGRPWTIAAIAAGLAGRAPVLAPSGPALVELVRRHYDAMLDFYGPHGARAARKHLGWYMDDAGTPPALRRRILTGAPAEVSAMLADALAGPQRQAA